MFVLGDCAPVPEPFLSWGKEGSCGTWLLGEGGSLLRNPLEDDGPIPRTGCDFRGWWGRPEPEDAHHVKRENAA